MWACGEQRLCVYVCACVREKGSVAAQPPTQPTAHTLTQPHTPSLTWVTLAEPQVTLAVPVALVDAEHLDRLIAVSPAPSVNDAWKLNLAGHDTEFGG